MASPTSLTAINHIDGMTQQIVDVTGKTRFFRGMSVAYKAYPWLPDTEKYHSKLSFAQQDIELFQLLNLNLIRLALPWSAVQPRKPTATDPGWDERYLSRAKKFVQKLQDAGIYVIVECHQDLYAEQFCGNGFPGWTVTKDWWTLPFPMPISGVKVAQYDPALKQNNSKKATNEPAAPAEIVVVNDEDDKPPISQAPTNMPYTDDWGHYYASHAVTRAFYGFYNNFEGVQDAFCVYWAKMAEVFTGMEGVLGYEILNEPFPASRTTAGVPLALLYRSTTEKAYLNSLYAKVSQAIRKYDATSLIFYEPCCGGGSDSGDGLTGPPDGDKDRGVFAFHSYGPNLIDGLNIDQVFEKRNKDVRERLGGGVMCTEWDVEFVQGEERIGHVMDLADRTMTSWIGWQYKEFIRICGSPPHGSVIEPLTGTLRPAFAKLFSRPFPYAVAGTVHSFGFMVPPIQVPASTSTPGSVDAEMDFAKKKPDTFHLIYTPPSAHQLSESEIYCTQDPDIGWTGQWEAEITCDGVTAVGVSWENLEGRIKGSRRVLIKTDETFKGGKLVVVLHLKN